MKERARPLRGPRAEAAEAASVGVDNDGYILPTCPSIRPVANPREKKRD